MVEPAIGILLASTLITNLTLMFGKIKHFKSWCCEFDLQTNTGRLPTDVKPKESDLI
jgi:hypothetical protein